MADISKLDTSKLEDKKLNTQTPIPASMGFDQLPGEGIIQYANRMKKIPGGMASAQETTFNNTYGTNENNLKDMNEFSDRIPGLITEAQTMAPKQSNAYGGDPTLYSAIDRRAQENYDKDVKSYGSKLKQQDFEYRQNRLQQEDQKFSAIRQYEQAQQRLRDFQKAERKRKRGAVVGNVLGVVGAVVGGIFGGPMGAQAGMQGGQAVGNLAGGS